MGIIAACAGSKTMPQSWRTRHSGRRDRSGCASRARPQHQAHERAQAPEDPVQHKDAHRGPAQVPHVRQRP